MVRAARQVARHAVAQSFAAGGHGGSHRAPCALGHRIAPGEADLALRGGRQCAVCNRGDVFGGVGQRQIVVRRWQGHLQRHTGQLLRNSVAQHAVLGHGKTVALGQGQNEVVGVVGKHDVIVASHGFLGRRT